MRRVGMALVMLVGLFVPGPHPAALGLTSGDVIAGVGPFEPASGYTAADHGAEATSAIDGGTSAVINAAEVRTATAELVAVTHTSQFLPPSTDPSGIVWIEAEGRLLVSDSEVNETPFFTGSNLFWVAPSGTLVDHGTTTSFSSEPTGLGFDPAGNRLFVSDDNKAEVFEIHPGPDDRFGTSDDVASSFSTAVFGSTDPEGVEYDPVSGTLFIVDGRGTELYRVDPGPNGLFDGLDSDDLVSSFDLGIFGSLDPEGIGLDPVRGILVVVDKPSNLAFEVRKNGELVRIIDMSAANSYLSAGVAVAPGSLVPSDMNLYVVDRGVDNSVEPNQNDGKLYELRIIAPPGDPFVDDNDSVHEAFINALEAAGITKGCNPPANTLYCPRDPVTRGQMASFLARALRLDPAPADWFLDDNSSVHEADINAIAAVGITLGCNPPENSRFCPNDVLTRAQMASLLKRALDLDPSPVDRFVDDDLSVHESDINAIAAAGITLGCNPPINDAYCPENPVTREEMASLLGRALGLDPLPVR